MNHLITYKLKGIVQLQDIFKSNGLDYVPKLENF